MTDTTRLERISVDAPCPKRWAELEGDEARRYCSSCELHVTNLSALTREEGEAFLAGSDGRVCVTYVPDAEGRVTPVDELLARRATPAGACSEAERTSPRRGRTAIGAFARAAGFLFGLLALVPGCRQAESELMGAVPVPFDPEGPEVDHPLVLGDACVSPENPIDGVEEQATAQPGCIDEEPRILGRMLAPMEPAHRTSDDGE